MVSVESSLIMHLEIVPSSKQCVNPDGESLVLDLLRINVENRPSRRHRPDEMEPMMEAFSSSIKK